MATQFNTGHIYISFRWKILKRLLSKPKGLSVSKVLIAPSGNKMVDVLAEWFPNLFEKVLIEIDKGWVH